MTMKSTTSFSGLLEGFFSDRLRGQRCTSSHTIACYRDSFRLLLKFARDRLGKAPSQLAFSDLDAPFIGAFLHYLEHDRGNCAHTRNIRRAAIHSFFHYVAYEVPEHSALIQRVLAIPNKRFAHKPIDFLSSEEVSALLTAPNLRTWGGRRDRALLLLAVQTGLRVSELVGLNGEDLVLGSGSSCVRCQGKGRKERLTPLRAQTAAVLRDWLREREGRPEDPLFPNVRGGRLSRDGVEHLLAKHVIVAAKECPGLLTKRVSPHVLRHTAAMDLLQHGVDRSVIALWLGHESIATTEIYIHADMSLKEKALARASPLSVPPGRFKPDDHLLGFLDSL